jgi:hypothetical protein
MLQPLGLCRPRSSHHSPPPPPPHHQTTLIVTVELQTTGLPENARPWRTYRRVFNGRPIMSNCFQCCCKCGVKTGRYVTRFSVRSCSNELRLTWNEHDIIYRNKAGCFVRDLYNGSVSTAGVYLAISDVEWPSYLLNLTLYLPCIFKWDMFNNHQLMHINFFSIVYS